MSTLKLLPVYAALTDNPHMTEPTASMTQTKSAQPNLLLESLSARYAVFKDCKPLAVGIHKAIMIEQPEISLTQLKVAVKRYTQSTRYLKAVAAGTDRYDLTGAVSGSVTDEQKALANETLKDRFRKMAERKRTELEAQKKAQEEQKEEQQKAAKLNQLLEKFSTR